MEDPGCGVLQEYLDKIKYSNVDPSWLAGKLFAKRVIKTDDVEKAGSAEVTAKRLETLILKVMRNGTEGVFQTFVECFLQESEYKWLGDKMKDAFIGREGVWKKQPTPEPPKPTGGTLRPEGPGEDEGPDPTPVKIYKQGLAILVTCDYQGSLQGTHVDAKEMTTTINEFKYHLVEVKNEEATKSKITTAIRNISGDGVDIIMFVFSGHGASGGKIVSQKRERLSLKDDIIHPLLTKRSTPDIPVLFFIDACRGSEELASKSDPDQPMFDCDAVKGWIEEETNLRIDYATIDCHRAYINEESRWLPTVARQLRDEQNKDQSLADIMDGVKKIVWNQRSSKQQQPQSVDQLNCGPLFLHPRHGM